MQPTRSKPASELHVLQGFLCSPLSNPPPDAGCDGLEGPVWPL